ncbi:MAG: primosomal protein N' [Chloroflexi bacterium]|nr:primosomal protein N' [Chloroflexota bacterium]
MFAELVINIEAGLEGTFHYHVPADLRPRLRLGHLVEVEFGRRLAQGVVIAFSDEAPVEETKPVIALVDEEPVVQPFQIRLAQWLSRQYLAPLNGCIRLMLPPGLTRWSDTTLALNTRWDGTGRLTKIQQELIDLLKEKGDRRGRQIDKVLGKKSNWKAAANQLVNRDILIKATVLDPPRIKPKQIRTVELIAGPKQIRAAANQLGRASKQADVLDYLLTSEDPLPRLDTVLETTGATQNHIDELVNEKLVTVAAADTLILPTATAHTAPPEYQPILQQLPTTLGRFTIDDLRFTIDSLQTSVSQSLSLLVSNLQSLGFVELIPQPATLSLAIPPKTVLPHIFTLRHATVYEAILNRLRGRAQPMASSDLYADTGANLSHLKKLIELDLIRVSQEEVWRDPLADRDFTPAEAPLLTHDQARIWGRVKVAMLQAMAGGEEGSGDWDEGEDAAMGGHGDTATDDSPPRPLAPSPFLLHGVTGSGKTEIYMRAIELALEFGQQAIVLVPEIALTPQTVRRFAARFPGQVAVLHSRLSEGERFDTWRRARAGLFDIIVGARSALFTPLPNLGVIVVDEEHDPSYKQTPPVPPPYYHARDAAIALGEITGAAVIMGSATPDLVTYHRARAERYQLLELPRRVMGHRQRIQSQAERLHLLSRYTQSGDDPDDAMTIPLPPVQVVDLRQELRAGNRSIFSRALQTALDETLARGEQAILFLNRRGTHSFVMCRDCGLVLKCGRCDMPLTFHRPQALLVCHYCGRKEPQPDDCPQCGSKRIRYFGLGTEELEEQVQQRWPEARLVRWDRDTTAGRDSHEQLLASFINQESDILVGTQMIAKGLDLPLVTLVGVISADVSLGLPDYRTGERTFQILTQVAGRAGRGLLGGRVIVQTYQPEHYAIIAAASHDYTQFYLEEIRFRTQHSLPPFRRLARLIIADPVDQRAKRQADELAHGLRLHIRDKALGGTEILGPTPPFFSRIEGRYRWQIIIRSPDPIRLLEDFPIPTPWVVDIDPVSTL